MNDSTRFKVYCLELFKNSHNLYGSEALCLFQKCGVSDYIDSHYDKLHTCEASNIVKDLNEYILSYS